MSSGRTKRVTRQTPIVESSRAQKKGKITKEPNKALEMQLFCSGLTINHFAQDFRHKKGNFWPLGPLFLVHGAWL